MKITVRQPLGFSEIGRKDNQEDCLYPALNKVGTENRFFVLCDGMGGHENGEVASTTVCEAFGKYFETNQPEDGIMTTDLFKQALEYAYNELDKKDSGGFKKMGTTMTCLYLHKNGYLVAHIGDSRIYHIRPNTGVVYQSSDHSLVNDLLRAGELTEEEAVNFSQKNVITRAMQPNLERRHKADVFSFTDIKGGDYFFLCCDGVLEQLTNDKLCEVLSDKKLSDNQKLDAIKQVCDGKTKDNYTCFLIPIDQVDLEKDDLENINEDIVGGVELVDKNLDSNIVHVSNNQKELIIKQLFSTKYKRGLGLVLLLIIALVGISFFYFIPENEVESMEHEGKDMKIKFKEVELKTTKDTLRVDSAHFISIFQE